MKTDRRKSRELALQALFSFRMQNDDEEESPKHLPEIKRELISSRQVKKHVSEYAAALADEAIKHKREFDKEIDKAATNWDLDRFSMVDRMLIHLALTEIRYMDNVPGNIAINEALEIAKDYSSDDSVPFINGVLDSVYKRWLDEGIVFSSDPKSKK